MGDEEPKGFLFGRSKYIFSYGMDRWYELLKKVEDDTPELAPLTPKTFFLPLDSAQATAIRTSNFEQPECIELTSQIDDIIANKLGGKAFAKLSTRSPKDAATNINSEIMQKNLIEELDKEENGDDNKDTIAFVNATRKSLIVSNAKQVFDLFAQSSRIQEDLLRRSEFENNLELSVVIREWIDGLTGDMKFRGFVYKNKLTAISQYCYYQYFPHLVAQREFYQSLMCDLFAKIPTNAFPYENYVIDFAISKQGNSHHVWIIELNPFFRDTSGCLFDWSRDKAILYGEQPFEFRVLYESVDDPKGCLSREWRQFINKHRGIEEKSLGPLKTNESFQKSINPRNTRNTVTFAMGFVVLLGSYFLYKWATSNQI